MISWCSHVSDDTQKKHMIYLIVLKFQEKERITYNEKYTLFSWKIQCAQYIEKSF